MPSRNSQKRAAKRVDHTGRLRRLKGIAVGISALLTVGFWALVSSAVASTQSTPAQSTTPAVTTQPFGDDGSSFGEPSNPSLGGSSSVQRPMTRSGGS